MAQEQEAREEGENSQKDSEGAINAFSEVTGHKGDIKASIILTLGANNGKIKS